MEERIGVDCQFEADGTLLVRRIFIDGRWLVADQGRQWVDHLGRHVLIMLTGGEVREILLRPDTLTWSMLSVGKGRQVSLV